MNRDYLPKEKAIYQAVIELFEEGADVGNLTVSEITARAGIGKGTAYEYFTGKEEMIAKAFFYNGEMFCCQLYDKIEFVLLTMEQQVSRTNCIFRLIHMLSDNSSLSGWIRELLQQKKMFGEMLAEEFIRKILNDELKGRSMPSEDQMAYLVFNIYSKIFCYGMFLKDERYIKADNRETMRRLVNLGICREIEEIFSLK